MEFAFTKGQLQLPNIQKHLELRTQNNRSTSLQQICPTPPFLVVHSLSRIFYFDYYILSISILCVLFSVFYCLHHGFSHQPIAAKKEATGIISFYFLWLFFLLSLSAWKDGCLQSFSLATSIFFFTTSQKTCSQSSLIDSLVIYIGQYESSGLHTVYCLFLRKPFFLCFFNV